MQETCIICGKKIKGKPVWFVHMTTAGAVVPAAYTGSDSFGAHPIGAACAKKYPGLAFSK